MGTRAQVGLKLTTRGRRIQAIFSRTALYLLGGFMAWSAAEHWTGSAGLGDYYAASPGGLVGLWVVAGAQTVAACRLLRARSQVASGFVLASIMAVVAALHVGPGGVGSGALRPALLGAWAAAASWGANRASPGTVAV